MVAIKIQNQYGFFHFLMLLGKYFKTKYKQKFISNICPQHPQQTHSLYDLKSLYFINFIVL